MRNPAHLAALAIGAAALLPAATAQNLLSDPGFETDFATEEMPAQLPGSIWDGFGNGFISPDNNQQSGGFQAVKFFQGFSGPFDVGAGAFQTVPVTAGTTYKFSTLLRNGPDVSAFEADPMTPGNYLLAKVEWKDAAGFIVAAYEDQATMRVDWEDTPFEWVCAEFIDIAPPGATQAQVVFLHFYNAAFDDDPDPATNGGSSWADDVSFEVTSEQTPEAKTDNLLTNGGFETPDAGGGPADGWTALGNAIRYENNVTALDGTPDFGVFVLRGLASVTMFQNFPVDMDELPTNEANDSVMYQDVAVTAGQSYAFTAAARNGNGFGEDLLATGNSAIIQIEWRDGSDQTISTVEDPVNGGIDGTYPRQGFKQLGIQGVAPAGAVTARLNVVHIYDGSGTPGSNGGSSWFDDLCFRQGTLPEPPAGPAIKEIVRDDFFEEVTITFATENGATYRVRKSTTLEPGSFTEVVEDNIAGDGTDYVSVDVNASGMVGFYIVEQIADCPAGS